MKRTSTLLVRSLMSASVVLVGVSLASAQMVTVDGNRDNLYGFPRVWQTVQTGYGDNSDASATGANGSELVAAYSYIGGGNLNLFFSGNLQNGGNKIFVFLDTDSGNGQNRLRGDNTGIAALLRLGDSGGPNGLIFESGFTADHAFVMNADGTSLFVDYSPLPTSAGGTASYLGASALGGGAGGLGGGSNFLFAQACLHNGNTAGVGGGSSSGQIPTMPTTGLEMSIPLSALGTINQSVKVFAFISNDTGAFLSNQFLPDVGANGATVGNFNEPRGIDFSAAGNPGTQFFYVEPRTKNQIWASRLGSGSTQTSGSAYQVSIMPLDPFAPNQSPAALLTLSANSSPRLTTRISSPQEGYIARSNDGRSVAFTGYDHPAGSTGVTSSTVSRSVAVVGSDLNPIYRVFTEMGSNSARSIAALDAQNLWVTGDTTVAAYFVPLPTGTISNRVTSGGGRQVEIVNNRLLVGGQTTLSTTPSLQVFATAPGTTLGLSPAPTDSHDFAFAGPRTVYVSQNTGGITRYNYATSWTTATVVSVATLGGNPRGLTVRQNASGQNEVFATLSNGRVVSFVDNETSSPTVTTLTPTVANFFYQGVALSPVPWQVPTATTDTGTTDQNVTLNVPAPGLLGNDTGEVLGGAELVGALTPPSAGSVTVNANGSYTFIPANGFTGNASFTYRFTDGDTFSAPATVNLTVNAVNQPPVLGAIGNQSVDELATLTLNLSANDPNNDSLTYSADALPVGATLVGNVFSWTPTEAQGPDSVPITFTVSDGNGGTDSEAITITVNEVNSAPIWGTIDAQSAAENAAFSVNVSSFASDGDVPANSLTFSKVSGPAGLTISAAGLVEWTPGETDGGGTPTVTVRATDNGLPVQFTDRTFTINVDEVNAPPTLAAITNQTVEAGQLLSFNAVGDDPNDDPENALTYSLQGVVPAGASIDSSTGAFTWTPTLAQGPQVYNLTVRVTDNGTPILFAEQSVQVTVTVSNADPILDPIGNKSVYEDQVLTFDASATDPDSDTLTYSLGAGAPYGAYINPANGQFTFRPAPIQTPNNFSVTVIVEDGNGGTDSELITINAQRETRTANPLVGWGYNGTGALALNDLVDRSNPTVIGSLTGASRIFGVGYNAFARDPLGGWHGWGFNFFGQIGNGVINGPVVPLPVTLPNLAGIVDLGGGEYHSIGLLTDGTFKSWGVNGHGQLGLGFTSLGEGVPQLIPSVSGGFGMASGIGSRYSHLVLASGNPLTDGQTLGMGVNEVGQLGIGTNITPQLVPVMSNLTTGVRSISSGSNHVIALRNDLTVWSTGDNTHGQLGIGTFAGQSLFSQVPGLTNVVQVSAGKDASYAVRRDGTVWAWGRNLLGKLGDGTTITSNVPVQVSGLTNVKEVFATEESAIALKSDGTVWAWGSNVYGMLGDGTVGGSSTVPVQVPGLVDIDRVRTIGNAVFAWKYGLPNAAPVAEDDVYAATEDTPLVVNAASGVIANDTDDQPISVLRASLVSAPNPAQGSVVLNVNGSFTFTPAANFSGAASFTYKVNDWQLDSNTATVTINVGGVNDDPVLTAIGGKSVDELTLLSFNLASSDIDGGSPVYSSSVLPDGATLVGNTFSWTPSELQGPGPYPVTFTVSDGFGGTDSETITITVNEVNVDPELAAIGAKSVDEQTLLTFSVSATDGDLPANALSYSATGLPDGATFTGTTFSWTPTEAQGPGSFNVTFSVSDGAGGNDSEVVTITVNEVNTAPVADNQLVNATEDTPKAIVLTANDAQNDPLTWSYGQPSHGVVTGIAPNLTYTPNADFAGVDSFTFTVNDGLVNSNVATVTINVVDVLDMDVTVIGSVAPNAFGSPSFSAYAARAMASLENTPGVDDGDRSLDPTAYDAVTTIPWYDNAATGTPFWMGVQNPAAPFNLELGHRIHFGVRFLGKGTRFSISQLDFEWTSSDNNSLGFTDTWSAADVYSPNRRGIDYGTDRVKGGGDDVIITSGPADQMVDELVYLGYGNAWDATLTPGATPAEKLASLRCYLEQEAPIIIQGTYKVRDGNGGFLGEGTGTVTLVPTNNLPVAGNQMVSVDEDSSVGITLTAIDTDPFELPLGYSVVDGPTNGTLSGLAPNLVYTPNTNYFGPDSFTFIATDCVGDSNIATVTINVVSVNDDPVLAPIGGRTVNELEPLTITLASSDIDGGAAVYTATGLPIGASLGGNTFQWTPSEVQGPGSYDITFNVSDGNGGTDSEVVTIVVNEVNVAPELAPVGDKTVDEMTQLAFAAVGSDSDLPANTLTYSLIDAPAGASINELTGAFTWTPTEVQGPDSYTFTVKVSDGLLSDEEEITVTVAEANVAPELAVIGDKSVNELALLTFTASATDSDLPANTLTYSLVGAPAGAVIDESTGVFTWTPTEAQGPSPYTFTVRVSDGNLTDTEVITVTVAEVNTPPVANAQTLGTGINQALNITLTGSDTDIPVQTLTYQVVSQPTNGVLSGVEPNMVYTPNPGYSGPDSFTFKANDGVEDSIVETITINVSGLAILLDLQFEGFQSDVPVTRGVSITFGGLSGAGNLPVTLNRDLLISGTGQASLVLTNADIPNLQANEGNYGISVKDNLHTLRTTQQLTWTGTGYTGNISIRGGNLNKDGKIDVGDYIVYAVRVGTPVDRNTPLALQVNPSFRHADISGDGVVDSIDFSFISAGFGTQFDHPLVGEYGRGDDPIRTRITVTDAIRESGTRDAMLMDLNRDGWISLAEIQAYLTKR